MNDPRRVERCCRPARRRRTRSGRGSGVELGFDEPVAYVRAFGEKIPGARPSMLLDYLAGRRTEIDFINGAIPRVGREVGVATPLNETVTALVKALERR